MEAEEKMPTRTDVRQDPSNPNRWIFDFDRAAVGGRGGASVLLDPDLGLASFDGVHKNVLLPRRSTGRLLADGLVQVGMPRPAVLEGYNVEKTTRTALATGAYGQATLIGNLLEDTAAALGASVALWEPIPDGPFWHLRVHLSYP